MSRLWYGLLDLIFPRRCLQCGEIVPSRYRPVPICDRHWGTVESVPDQACRHCARAMDSDRQATDDSAVSYPRKPICGRCRKREVELEFLLAGYRFGPALREIVSDWKYDNNPEWGSWLAARLAGAVSSDFNPSNWDGLVPVPMYYRRRRDRGFNQARQLAEGLAEAWECPLKSVLTKDRRTDPQSSLGREQRLRNLNNAFSLQQQTDDFRGQKFLVVDDIYTTGSTVRTAAGVLRGAGAASIGGIVLARTPPE